MLWLTMLCLWKKEYSVNLFYTFKNKHYSGISVLFTLSLLGYLKTRICWGVGSIWPPPPLNPMFNVQTWQMIHHWKAIVLFLRICKKFCKNWIFYRKIQLYSKNVCKKICPKNEKLYIFEKPLTMPFQICKKILQNFK